MNGATGSNGQNTQTTGEEQSLARRGWEQAWKPFKALLDWISPLLTGTFSALALGISLAIDHLIYFPALGISIFEMPISIADNVRSAVIWLPPFIVATVVAVGASCLPAILLPESIYSSKIIHRKNGKLSLAPASHYLIGLPVLLAICLLLFKSLAWISYWISGQKPICIISLLCNAPWWAILVGILLFFLFTGIFAWISHIITTKSKNSTEISIFSFSSVVYLIISVVCIAFFVHYRAHSDQSRAKAIDCQNQTELALIRSFEQYLLVGRCGNWEFLNTDQVDRIAKNEHGKVIVIPQNKDEWTCPPCKNQEQSNSLEAPPTPPEASPPPQLSAEQQ